MSRPSLFAQDPRTKQRNAAEKRFRAYGLSAIVVALLALVWLLISIFGNGLPAFRQTFLTFPVTLDAAILDKAGSRDPAELAKVTTVGYAKVLAKSLEAEVAAQAIDLGGMKPKDVAKLISEESAATLRNLVLADPSVIGQTISFKALASGRVDGYYKGRVSMDSAAKDKNTSPEQLALADKLKTAGVLSIGFNTGFLTMPDASDKRPEAAGLGVAIVGSLYMMIVVLLLALPIGVAASIYLEEFAPKNRWTDLIEVNIANLAAVPSIVYGILGLAIFINILGMPQSAPIVGGLVLTLMSLPRIIIPTRAALKAVPPSIRDAALGVGASKLQTVFHHVLPLAMPGILTGTIIGLAQALGETAPLLLIGMVAFVRDFPGVPFDGLFDPAAAEEWLEALDGQEHITDFYIVTPAKRVFDQLKAQVAELLGPVLVPEEEKRPMSAGFAANLAYFKLDFLERERVSLRRAFHEILPLLWLKAGAVGPRPELKRGEPEPVLFAPEGSNFVVLLDETRMGRLLKSLEGRTGLSLVFIVTDADESFKTMAQDVREVAGKANHGLAVVQLYRDYLLNFMINKNQDRAAAPAKTTAGTPGARA